MRYWLTGTVDQKTKIQDKKLEKIASKCTELAPSMRYQSAAALKKALCGYKKRTKRLFITVATAITALLAISLGIYALSTDWDNTPVLYQTPVGYNDAEYQQLVALFLYEDNLSKIKAQHSGFDIENPATWYWERGGTWISDDGTEHPLTNFVAWAWGRVEYIHLYGIGLTGVLNVSGFDQLQTLDVPNNNFTEVNLSGCISLRTLQVDRDILAKLDLSGLPALEFVN
jgi:hypothetical protein